MRVFLFDCQIDGADFREVIGTGKAIGARAGQIRLEVPVTQGVVACELDRQFRKRPIAYCLLMTFEPKASEELRV